MKYQYWGLTRRNLQIMGFVLYFKFSLNFLACFGIRLDYFSHNAIFYAILPSNVKLAYLCSSSCLFIKANLLVPIQICTNCFMYKHTYIMLYYISTCCLQISIETYLRHNIRFSIDDIFFYGK